MKNKILALIFTTLVALIIFSVAFGFVALMGFDIKPLEGSGRTQGEAMAIGSAFIAIMFIGFINGIRGLFRTFDWFVKEFDKPFKMDLNMNMNLVGRAGSVYPDSVDDVLVKIASNGNEAYGDSLYRIGWYDGSWGIYGQEDVEVVSWREINLQK